MYFADEKMWGKHLENVVISNAHYLNVDQLEVA